MLKRRSVVLALALCLALAWDSWGQSSDHPQPKAQKTKQAAAADQRGTKQAPIVVEVLPAKDADEKTNRDEEERKNKNNADWWLVKLTGILAAIGFLQLLVFGWQGIQLKNTVKTTKEAADAAVSLERPYLFIAKIHLREGVMLADRTTATCEYTIENYGKTPAILAFSCVDLRLLQGLPKQPKYKNITPWRDRLVYQREPIGENEFRSILPESDQDAYNRELEGHEMFLLGYFTFYDVFGKRRKTGFCYRLDRTMGSNTRVRIPAYHYDIEEKE